MTGSSRRCVSMKPRPMDGDGLVHLTNLPFALRVHSRKWSLSGLCPSFKKSVRDARPPGLC
jgi:hypothetical protein